MSVAEALDLGAVDVRLADVQTSEAMPTARKRATCWVVICWSLYLA